MSLQKSTTFSSTLVAANAVHKILCVAFNAPNGLYIEIGVFVDLTKSQDGVTPPVERRTFNKMTGFDPAAAQNVHTQAYNYLKTLPEYEGAVDV